MIEIKRPQELVRLRRLALASQGLPLRTALESQGSASSE